jgi:hypothetical protein
VPLDEEDIITYLNTNWPATGAMPIAPQGYHFEIYSKTERKRPSYSVQCSGGNPKETVVNKGYYLRETPISIICHANTNADVDAMVSIIYNLLNQWNVGGSYMELDPFQCANLDRNWQQTLTAREERWVAANAI